MLGTALCLMAVAVLAQAPGTPARAAPKRVYALFETSRGKIGVELLPGEAPKTVANFVDLATGKKPFKDPFTQQDVSARYYDGTLFHRVIPGFMIQGGDPVTRDADLGSRSARGVQFGISGPGYRFEDELPPVGEVKEEPAKEEVAKGGAVQVHDLGGGRIAVERNDSVVHRRAPQPISRPGGGGLFDKPCVLAMANSGPNTNGSQFFITEGFGGQVSQLEPRRCGSPSGVCGYTRFGKGVCGCELVGQIAKAGHSQTRLVKVTILDEPPSCK